MADNLAYQDGYQEEYRSEMLDGNIVLMAPRPAVDHNRVAFNIARAFADRLKGKRCEAFADGTEVYLTRRDHVVPDAMIVCNREFIRRNGIHGTPDLIVEVLSHGTAYRDRGYKKDLYERCGVKEYWIVSPRERSIEVYLLKDGKFSFDAVYEYYPDYDDFASEEKVEHKADIPVSLYDDFSIPLDEIFYNLF